jgi:hypothetical protein
MLLRFSGQSSEKMLLPKYFTDDCIHKHMALLPEIYILEEHSLGILGAFMNGLVAVEIRA